MRVMGIETMPSAIKLHVYIAETHGEIKKGGVKCRVGIEPHITQKSTYDIWMLYRTVQKLLDIDISLNFL